MDGYLDNSHFIPQGQSYLWRPEILWLHFISDLVIAMAYFSIPVVLLYFIRRRPQALLPHRWIMYMFSTLMICCGLTHVLSIVTIWMPIYFWQGILKAATASISFSTAILMIPLAPRFFEFKNESKLDI